MLKCSEATRLLSDELERPLTRAQSFALRLHVLMCSGCRNFGAQIRFLCRVGRACGDPDSDEPRRK